MKKDKGKTAFSWINPKLKVGNAEECGKGVFSKVDIPKDEVLAIFGGYVLDIKDEANLPEPLNDYGLQIHERFVLGIMKKSEIFDTDFFNHSCEPNAGFKGQIFLVAMKNISKGEEITFDYAMVLHSVLGLDSYKLKCLCKRKGCRGIVSDNDWQKKELQDKYDGYFQFYIQEKINKLKMKKNVLY